MKSTRRHFLATSALAVGALAAPRGLEAQAPPSPMAYRTLGRTGLKVSEIGFGGYPSRDPKVVEYALERGINYFDTAPCYPGDSETSIGKGLRGKRDRAVLATKWCPHHDGKPATRASFVAQLDRSLQRLQTDHVDVLFNHQVGPSDGQSRGNDFSRLDNPELWAAWDEVKKAGKARFFGVSGHEGNLMEIMKHVVASGKFDVILCRYNFLDYPSQPDLVRLCAQHNVGFVAMKTLAGARGADIDGFRDKHTSFKQAALKWVLSNRDVSNLVISISDKAQVDEYAVAAGQPLSAPDVALLQEYRSRFSAEQCRFASDCEPACPHGVRVSDILRASMYFHQYREEKHGITEYAALPADARAVHCSGCSAPCQKACPHGLQIKDLLLTAHRTLSVTPGAGA